MTRVVISDWRYHVELNTIRAAFPDTRVVAVRIIRGQVEQRPHPSEHELDGMIPDVTIINDGSISDLRDALKASLRPYLHGPSTALLIHPPSDSK